jgi:phospholipid/cholesterol/gamma-HCH transport system substrate-binding protein
MAKKFKFRYVNEIVGGFVLLVCLLLVAGIIVAGNAQQWFEKMAEIELRFPPEGSMDLQKGAEVMLLGARVGSVQDIAVDDNGNITGSIRVRGSFMRFVRDDSIALVKKKLVVTGDAYIELTRGTGKELPKTGGEIYCVQDTEILSMLEEMVSAMQVEAKNTLALVNAAIEEYTQLAEGINDPDGDLQQILGHANGLMGDVREAALVAQVDELLESINAMAKNLEIVVATLPPMAQTVAGEVDQLPVLVGETQTLMRESTVLLEGLQRHWFLRKYVETDDAILSQEVLLP